MNGDTKLILDRMEKHTEKVDDRLRVLGEGVVRIDERTKLQGERLNRLDRRTAGISALIGTLTAAAATAAKSLGFGNS